MANNDGTDPFDGEPGPRLRGATWSAKKGMLAHLFTAILKHHELTLAELSSADGAHFIDQKFLRKIVHGESFPDYDTFANLIDALLELRALSFLVLKRLEYVYAEESMAWDRSYRDASGRVSETRPQGDRDQNRTERSQRTQHRAECRTNRFIGPPSPGAYKMTRATAASNASARAQSADSLFDLASSR